MLSIRTSEQLRTRQQVKSFRSCPTSTGLPGWGAELGRICQAEVARCQRELRRQWLATVWQRQRRGGR